MKVFLDANILFSASVSTSRIAKLLAVVRQHGSFVTNFYAVEEARKNLELKKFGTPEGLESLLAVVSIIDTLRRERAEILLSTSQLVYQACT